MSSAPELRDVLARLNEASSRFLMMMAIADNDARIETKRLFDKAYLATSRGMSDARDLNNEYEARISSINRKIAELGVLAKEIQSRQDVLQSHVFEVVSQTPGVTYRDDDGQKVYVAKNGQAKLTTTLDLRDKTVRNIVDDWQVDPIYIKPVSYLVLDTDKVRETLASGVELPWAKLETGSHLRGI